MHEDGWGARQAKRHPGGSRAIRCTQCQHTCSAPASSSDCSLPLEVLPMSLTALPGVGGAEAALRGRKCNVNARVVWRVSRVVMRRSAALATYSQWPACIRGRTHHRSA